MLDARRETVIREGSGYKRREAVIREEELLEQKREDIAVNPPSKLL